MTEQYITNLNKERDTLKKEVATIDARIWEMRTTEPDCVTRSLNMLELNKLCDKRERRIREIDHTLAGYTPRELPKLGGVALVSPSKF